MAHAGEWCCSLCWRGCIHFARLTKAYSCMESLWMNAVDGWSGCRSCKPCQPARPSILTEPSSRSVVHPTQAIVSRRLPRFLAYVSIFWRTCQRMRMQLTDCLVTSPTGQRLALLGSSDCSPGYVQGVVTTERKCKVEWCLYAVEMIVALPLSRD